MKDISQKTLEEVAASEDELALLKALRQKLCQTLDVCESGRDIAALSHRLCDVIAAIKEIETESHDNEIDDIIKEHKLNSPSGLVRPYKSQL